jgi:hypothetical protein
MQHLELDLPVRGGIQMLQPTAAARPEMSARRSGAPGPEGEPVDNQRLPPALPAGSKPSADALTRHRERDKHRLTTVLRYSVPSRTDPLDYELDQLPAACR